MGIEIEILSGDAAWPAAQPLLAVVWPPDIVKTLPWGNVVWARADLRVLIATEAGDTVCHVGIFRRAAIWNGRKVRIGGLGGVATRDDHRRRGYASVAIDAAVQTLRDERTIDFGLLFCEPHNVAFYKARGWHAFEGEVFAEQPGGRIRFEATAPFVFDLRLKPRRGTIDLCGLPW